MVWGRGADGEKGGSMSTEKDKIDKPALLAARQKVLEAVQGLDEADALVVLASAINEHRFPYQVARVILRDSVSYEL